MTYRERLERYKRGEGTPEERAQIEAELEKNEAIADYLAEELDDRLTFDTGNGAEEARMIQKRVRGRLRRTVAVAVTIAVAVMALGALGINWLVNTLSYAPDAVEWDLSVLYELLQPGKDAKNLHTDSLGFGRYTLSYTERDWLTGLEQPVQRTLDPTEVGQNAFLTKQPVRLLGMVENGGSEADVEFLRQMDDMGYVSAWVLFPNDLTPRALAQLVTEYEETYDEGVQFCWAAVRGTETMVTLGFDIGMGTGVTTTAGVEGYPLLNYGELLGGQGKLPGGNVNQYLQRWSEIYTQHFESLLDYAADHTEATEALAGPIQVAQYDFASQRDYVEQNGIQIYGALVFGQPSVLLKLLDDGKISDLCIDTVLASRYSGSQEIRQ